MLVSSPHTAPRIISVMEILKTVNPATVWSCGAGPKSALVALFEPYAAAKRVPLRPGSCRSSCS